LPDDARVVFLGQASQGFEGHDEQDDADAGQGEGAVGADVPAARDEAWNLCRVRLLLRH
jgi:hypothetical protein